MELLLDQSLDVERENLFEQRIAYSLRCSKCSVMTEQLVQHDWQCVLMDNRNIRKPNGKLITRLPQDALYQKALDLEKGLSHPWFTFSEEAVLRCSCSGSERVITGFQVKNFSHCIWIQVDHRECQVTFSNFIQMIQYILNYE
jgi:hypothetical protein